MVRRLGVVFYLIVPNLSPVISALGGIPDLATALPRPFMHRPPPRLISVSLAPPIPLSFRVLPMADAPHSPPTLAYCQGASGLQQLGGAGDVGDYALRLLRAVFVAGRCGGWRRRRFGGGVVFGVGGDWRDHVGAGGFVNAFWAILATGLIIALAGGRSACMPQWFGVDMICSSGAPGFGYIGSTITSLDLRLVYLYLFALEAAIMAYALEMSLGLQTARRGGICCAPGGDSVGDTRHHRHQPGCGGFCDFGMWLALLVLPYAVVLTRCPQALAGLWAYGGGGLAGFDLQRFGAALTVEGGLDHPDGRAGSYLRFMPAAEGAAARWWLAVALAGRGGCCQGWPKMLGGACWPGCCAARAWRRSGRWTPIKCIWRRLPRCFIRRRWRCG